MGSGGGTTTTNTVSKPIFPENVKGIVNRLGNIGDFLLNPQSGGFGSSPRSESGRGTTPVITGTGGGTGRSLVQIQSDIDRILRDEDNPEGGFADELAALRSELSAASGGGGAFAGNIPAGGGNILSGGGEDAGSRDAFLESLRFRNLTDEFGDPVLGLRPEEEALRTGQVGSLLASQGRTDALRSDIQRRLIAPNSPQEQSIIDASVNIGSGGFINPFTNSLIDRTQFELLKSTNAIRSQAGVAGAGGGSREAVLKGTAAGEATGRIGEILANAARFSESARAGEASRAFGFARQDISDAERAAEVEQRLGGGERRLQALQLEGVPRNIEQTNRDRFLVEESRRQSERFLPIQVAQSIAGQQAGQVIPVVTPNQSPLAGIGSVLSGAGDLFGAFRPPQQIATGTGTGTTSTTSGGGGSNVLGTLATIASFFGGK